MVNRMAEPIPKIRLKGKANSLRAVALVFFTKISINQMNKPEAIITSSGTKPTKPVALNLNGAAKYVPPNTASIAKSITAKISLKFFSCFPFRKSIPLCICLEPNAVYIGHPIMPMVSTQIALTKTGNVKLGSAILSSPKA